MYLIPHPLIIGYIVTIIGSLHPDPPMVTTTPASLRGDDVIYMGAMPAETRN